MSELAPLYKALAAAQAEITDPLKTAVNEHFRNRYADLAAITKVVRPVLAKHGLAIMQPFTVLEGNRVEVTTVLGHESGAAVRFSANWSAGQNIQHLGSAVTYLRRYTLCSILCIVGDDDDDGETLVAPTRKGAPNGR